MTRLYRAAISPTLRRQTSADSFFDAWTVLDCDADKIEIWCGEREREAMWRDPKTVSVAHGGVMPRHGKEEA